MYCPVQNFHQENEIFELQNKIKTLGEERNNLINFLSGTAVNDPPFTPRRILYTNSLNRSYIRDLCNSQIQGIIHKKDTILFCKRKSMNERVLIQNKEKFIKILKLVNEGCTFYDNIITTMLPKRYAWAKSDTQMTMQEFLKNDDKYLQKNIEKIYLLTKREKEILMLIAKGIQNKEIASTLHISTGTVEQHKVHIVEKMNLRNTKELAKFAIAYKETIVKI